MEQIETKEWTFRDRSDWKHPEYAEGEPDKKQWFNKKYGFPCLIVRNGFGNLCGYVGVDENHPLYGKDLYENLGYDDLEVHGGVTFTDFCGEEQEHGICHLTKGEEKAWWIGFDCGHCWDLSLDTDSYRDPEATYRDIAYVTKQIEGLAKQLKGWKCNDG